MSPRESRLSSPQKGVCSDAATARRIGVARHKTKYPGVEATHAPRCPGERGCLGGLRCTPSYRAQKWDPLLKRSRKSQAFPTALQALTWQETFDAGAELRADRAGEGPTFGDLLMEWWDLAKAGKVSKRRGRAGQPYSPTTLAGYEDIIDGIVMPTWGHRAARSIEPVEWQRWVDELSRYGASRSRILNILAVVRAVYAYATRPTRRLLETNAAAGLDLPAKDEKSRDRIALVPEAKQLLGALPPDIGLVYAIAMFSGLRRAEISRLAWDHVRWHERTLYVVKAKSEAGTGRAAPMGKPLVERLTWEHRLRGKPDAGRVIERSVFSGKLADAARKAWGWTWDAHARAWVPADDNVEAIPPITLHECRHTYASTLLAARYNIKEIMDFMGHDDLAATQRYLKRLPQPEEDCATDRLDDYLDGFGEA